MDNYLLGNLDQQTAFSGYQFAGRYFDEPTWFANGCSFGADFFREENTLNAPPTSHQPDANQPARDALHLNASIVHRPAPNSNDQFSNDQFSNDQFQTHQFPSEQFPNSDNQLDSYFVNRVEIAQASGELESEKEFDNLDLKSLKNFFYAENEETFLDDYLSNYESDLKPETLNGYVQSSETNNDHKPEQARSSLGFELDDFIRNELVGVTEDFELSYELDAFELPPELNEQIGKTDNECPPTNHAADSGECARESPKPRNQTKLRKPIRCSLCLYTSFDKHKVSEPSGCSLDRKGFTFELLSN